MENLKIRVNSESESKEAKELFFELGYEKGVCSTGGYPALIIATPESRFQKTPYSSRATSLNHEAHSQYKEITLPDLRDLVVLKRNYREDANVLEDNCLYDLYLTKSRELYFYHCGKNKWILSNLNGDDFYYELLKPIEKKEMKEYLVKSQDGKWRLETDLVGDPSDEVIEIPEGSNIAVIEDSKVKFYSKYTSADLDHLGKDLIWMRPSHPEELPFIDDEPSLNDQYAEIEKVRQSAWQKQEGGSHYKHLKIQPMQYALENKLDYAQANVVKYVTRHADKNGKEDLLKAIHNLELMIEFYYGDEK